MNSVGRFSLGQPTSDSCFLPIAAMFASASITLSAYLYNSLTYHWCSSFLVSRYIARILKLEVIAGPYFHMKILPSQHYHTKRAAKGKGYLISWDTCWQAALAMYSRRAVVKQGSRYPHMMVVYKTILQDLSSACFRLCTQEVKYCIFKHRDKLFLLTRYIVNLPALVLERRGRLSRSSAAA